ncbi:MAG: hypothetical protein ABI039_01740 [Vicinamibacterales bacterium]
MNRNSNHSRSIAGVLTFTLVFLAASAVPARADITAFLGLSPTPDNHAVKGFSAGLGLLVVGFEFEYANLSEDDFEGLPGLKTYAGNVLVQTPIEIAGTQFYATVGAEAYRETLALLEENHVGTNIGGGAKIKLLGPIRVRLDYRIFKLQGSPIHNVYQRFYVGGNLKF